MLTARLCHYEGEIVPVFPLKFRSICLGNNGDIYGAGTVAGTFTGSGIIDGTVPETWDIS